MIIGIDLGTTYSLGATLNLDHQPVLLPDNSDKNVLYTPSILHINGNNAFVGLSVLHMLEQNPDLNVIRFFKRYLGDNKELYMDMKNGDIWYPESVAALVLKKIKYDAEIYASNTVEGAVITVPAHFNDAQRKAVINAAAMIDLPVLGLVEEPVAAAMHYGLSQKANDQNILVYDLGGGTFDATVLNMNEQGFYVVSKDGLTDLGGKEFDEAIAEIIHNQFEAATGKPINFTGRKLQQLRTFSEEVKIELSSPGIQYVNRVCLIGNDSIDVFISRKEFEDAIRPDVERTIKILKRCVSSAGLTDEDIDVLLLVGGSSMVPFIKKYLAEKLPLLANKIRFHDPMKAVVFGASVYARMLTGNGGADMDMPSELKGVTGYNLAVRAVDTESGRTILDIIIKKNRPVPLKAKKTYYTAPNNNGKMRIELVQFIEENDIKTLGVLNVGPLPSNQANYPIDITLEYTEDNTIILQAYDPQTGRELEKTFGKEGMGANYLATQKVLVQKSFINNVV
ncbi:Hsp70 family protein [Neptunitalea lumnitzerae]|uniref:Chaperone protein DnaK n=1 Tax=Neptunitalea lumnitzerae TaxID=2965509 RepID=A0ABQ5MM53_9FLAO|nr:Hsp70 family protein [Neptunitalea sp. Y10]GLB50037.1 chaperone protein DnaK [Neptunitalea sp. Y10]